MSWLKNRMENDANVFERYHHDFRLLNGKLLHYYGIGSGILEGMDESHSIIDLEEVKVREIKSFLPLLGEDMIYSKQELDEKFNCFYI